MVRQKTRWMIVNLDFLGDSNHARSGDPSFFPTKKDLARAIQDNIIICFGTASSDAAIEIQVRICDAKTGLILIRVARDNFKLIRASLTMLTSLPVTPTSTTAAAAAAANDTNQTNSSSKKKNSYNDHNNQQRQPQRLSVVASIMSAHGSIRTAKKAAIVRVREIYRNRIQDIKRADPSRASRQGIDRECRAMEDMLRRIQSMD